MNDKNLGEYLYATQGSKMWPLVQAMFEVEEEQAFRLGFYAGLGIAIRIRLETETMVSRN